MKTNHKLKQQSGFTIIEVLIVLAIAGLIMLIVFLAVPALQRNSRNTQRRNDAAAVVGAVNEFVSTHNGSTPVASDGPALADSAKTRILTTISPVPIPGLLPPGTSFPFPNVTADNLSSATIYIGVKCGNISGVSGSVVGAGGRAVAVIFAVESSNGDPIAQCVEG